jgi:4-hydroxybenzoate polyprenyltransferase
MALNRVIDRKIDAMHPLHRERHVPSGQIRVWEMMVFSSIALALFLVSAWKLNPLAFILAFPAAAYVVGYSYAKRFTWIANLLLGGALAIGPAGAWVGVTGSLSWQALLLSGAVAMWAGAFDMIYHLPSREFYLEHGLHSIPQRFGVKATRIWARVYDACAVVALFILGLWVGLNVVYFIGLMSAAAILAYKHRILSRQDAVRPGKGFFKYNAMVSASVFAFTVLAFIV